MSAPYAGPVVSASTIDHDAWVRLRERDPYATVFHAPGWLSALTEAWPYYRMEWLTCVREQTLLGAMPTIVARRYGVDQRLSLPYGVPGTPLAENDDVRRTLLTAWWEAARAPRVVRAHVSFHLPPGQPGLPQWPGSATTRAEPGHLLDLRPGFDHIWSKLFDGDIRRARARAEREGMTVVVGRDADAVRDLDGLYREQAAEWTNHTRFPESFLPAVVAGLPENALIFRAMAGGVALAAQLVLFDERTAWSFLAPNSTEGRERLAPTVVYTHAIETMAARGFHWYHFGGSRGHRPLEKFKESLGGRPHDDAECLVEAAWFRPLHRLQYRLRGIRE